MNGKVAEVRSWLTPALLGTGVVLLGLLLSEIRDTRAMMLQEAKETREQIQDALTLLTEHDTILVQRGLKMPMAPTTRIPNLP